MPAANGTGSTSGVALTNGVAKTRVDYQEYHDAFKTAGLPQTEGEWLARASEVARIFAIDAAQRDIDNISPFPEVALLKSSGLTKILGPKVYGGGGQGWDVAYKAIRRVAQGDGSLGMLLGYHLLWSFTANIVGTDHQKDEFQKLVTENTYFIGGAVNPRDLDSKVTSEGDEIVFNGQKNFNTGGVISDILILEGVLEGTDDHIFTAVQTQQPGIVFAHNWNNIGLRLTESGSVKIENVRVPWNDALGWDPETKRPIQNILGVPFATLLLPTIQLVFSNFYLGIAQGALDFASKYTLTQTRAWPFGGDNKDSPTEEFYILERYGTYHAHLAAAAALADSVGSKVATLYANHQAKRSVSARERGEIAEAVAAVKVVTTDTGLDVTNGVFEVTGSRATGKRVGLDRFWRDIRTHSLHDPVAYKKRELGRWTLLDEIPEPTWYT